MSGKKHFAVISSQMDRAEKHAEKTANVKDSAEVKKTEETTESQPLQIPLDGDIPIFTEEFLNYNKGNNLTLLYGKLRERAVCDEFCVLIGYPSGQDGAILPARDCPFRSRK